MSRGADRSGDPPPPPEPLAVPAVDAHCHLDLIGGPVEQAVGQARAAGVSRLVTVGVDVATSRWSAQTAAAYDGVFAAVAIHPNEAGQASAAALAEIAALAREPAVRAVGETGLDFYRDSATPAEQEASFRAHIAIAKQSGRALMIHDREAHADVLRVLAEEGAPEQVIFHCFSGDVGFARQCVERGFVLSFAGNVTFRNAAYLRAAAAAVPAGQLLVETDAPFLTPTPYRGRPNGPYLIPLTVRCLAEVRGCPPEELAAAVSATAARVFGWAA